MRVISTLSLHWSTVMYGRRQCRRCTIG